MGSDLFKNFIKKAILNKQGAPGPAPRQGLVWKPQTHRWIKDPSAVDQEDIFSGFGFDIGDHQEGINAHIGEIMDAGQEWQIRSDSKTPSVDDYVNHFMQGDPKEGIGANNIVEDLDISLPDDDRAVDLAMDSIEEAVRSAVEENHPGPGGFGSPNEELAERSGMNAERVGDKMSDVLSDAFLDIQDEWGGRQGEMDGPTMEAKLRERLAEVYTTGADTNMFPHEEIAEAIGESPDDVMRFFDEEFNIDDWHEAPPMDLRGTAGDINNHIKEVLPSLIEQGYDEEDALGYFYAGWALDGETLDGVSVQEVLGLGHLGDDQEADDLSNLITDAIEEHYNGQ